MGVYNLLESIRDYKKKTKNKIRLVHVSTDEVYGDLAGKKDQMRNFHIILVLLMLHQSEF